MTNTTPRLCERAQRYIETDQISAARQLEPLRAALSEYLFVA